MRPTHPSATPGSPTRLPLQHPDYRYPGSLNIYSDKIDILKGRVFSNNETETQAGRWREMFSDAAPGAGKHHADTRRPLHVEIGCNAGHVVVEWAAQDPSTAYIGLDWKFKPIHRATEKGLKRGLGNLIFLRAHADRLPYMFGPGEIDRLCLYFPDPWAKKSQQKNRFLNASNLRRIAPLLSSGGVFHIKTDHAGYFEWMEAAVAEVGDLWEIVSHTRDLHAGNPDADKLVAPAVTLFEGLFIKDGIPIKSMELRRR